MTSDYFEPGRKSFSTWRKYSEGKKIRRSVFKTITKSTPLYSKVQDMDELKNFSSVNEVYTRISLMKKNRRTDLLQRPNYILWDMYHWFFESGKKTAK